jgi:hypothetical protein
MIFFDAILAPEALHYKGESGCFAGGACFEVLHRSLRVHQEFQ